MSKKDVRIAHNIREFVEYCGIGDTLHRIGRAVYDGTDCGPWLSFPVKNTKGDLLRGIYYQDKEAFEPASLNLPITGVEVGSIVEGSDTEVGPYYLQFPFKMHQFWDMVDAVNREASFYWERDNSDWYLVHGGKNNTCLATLHCTGGEFKWDSCAKELTRSKRHIEGLIKDFSATEANAFSAYLTHGRKVMISRFINDSTWE